MGVGRQDQALSRQRLRLVSDSYATCRHERRPCRHLTPHHDAHVVRRTVIHQGNRPVIDRHPIERRLEYAAATPLGIRHGDRVPRLEELPDDLIRRPRRGNTRVDGEPRTGSAQAQDALDARPIHPPRRPCIPTPSTATPVHGIVEDVAGKHIRFGLVTRDVSRIPGVVERVEHVEHLGRFIAASQTRQCHHDPRRCVCVLTAVLAHAWWVPFDIAWVLR